MFRPNPSFMALVPPWVRSFLCVTLLLLYLPVMELFIPFYGSSGHMTEALCHRCVSCSQVRFKVYTSSFWSLWLTAELLIMSSVLVSSSFKLNSFDTLTSQFVATGSLLDYQVCSSPSSFYDFLWLSSVFSPLPFSLLLLTWMMFTSHFLKIWLKALAGSGTLLQANFFFHTWRRRGLTCHLERQI